ncbi:preprotein translocase subunit SecY [candidate division WOR-3 bacterium]|nr:preprotein translocase subunit SecY [candidate division WOR-3 bacterium]
MFQKIRDAFKIPDLRNKILFTLAIFAVYRFGSHIICPGINSQALMEFFDRARGTILGLYDVFVGGNLSRGTIFGLGIMPYISSSIIFQLLGAALPGLQKLQREGEEGRRKINQYSRYLTVGIGAIQALGVAIFLESLTGSAGQPIVSAPGLGFRLLTILTLTAGTICIMWLGELITERGIGNGISLIIMIGIIARLPTDGLNTLRMLSTGAIGIPALVFLLAVMVGITVGVVLITQAQRKIPVQYAQRVIGRRIYGGRSTHIPLNVNAAGVIPIIFAQSILMFPGTIARFFSSSLVAQGVAEVFKPGNWMYTTIYAGLIVFFAYFYTSVVLNPTDMAENMKRYGGFIPGIRPGLPTANYIDKVISRITLPGALFFAFIAILPIYLINKLHAPFYFGGTSSIIVVGVALDTVRAIESQLIMRHYEGFIKKGRIRGRR